MEGKSSKEINDIHINWEQGNVQGYPKEWDCKDDLKPKNAPN